MNLVASSPPRSSLVLCALPAFAACTWSQMEQMAGRSADEAADYLGRLFSQQGWIAPQR